MVLKVTILLLFSNTAFSESVGCGGSYQVCLDPSDSSTCEVKFRVQCIESYYLSSSEAINACHRQRKITGGSGCYLLNGDQYELIILVSESQTR